MESDAWTELDDMVEECDDCGLLGKNELCPYHESMKDEATG